MTKKWKNPVQTTKSSYTEKGNCALIFFLFHFNWMDFIVPYQPGKVSSTNSSTLRVTNDKDTYCNLLPFRSIDLCGLE